MQQTMIQRRALATVLLGLVSVATAWADNLAAAYADVLRGDVSASWARLSALQGSGAASPELQQLQKWVGSYRDVSATRETLTRQTFDWHVERSKAELAKEGGNVYLALTFAARASEYAEDSKAFARSPWVQELSRKAAERAKELSSKGKWTEAHAFYLQLERIHGDNSEYKPLREESARHLRVHFLYPDKVAMQRRIVDVDQNMLYAALRQVNDNYFERPDFAAMALGALDGVQTLLDSKRLQKYLDGLGNEDSRKLFQAKLDQLRKSVQTREQWSWRDVGALFSDVLRANNTTISVPEGLLVVEFLEGALSKLDDFTSLIWPADATEFDKMMLGGFEGVGIQLGVDEETSRLKVVTPLENSPALEAGVQPDDIIEAVNGQSTKGWTTDDAVRTIMGPSGTVVTLTMFRPSTGERLNFDLKRRQIVLRTVRGVERVRSSRGDEWNYILDPAEGIAYLRLTGFHPESAEELEEALSDARKQGMKALVLDLRYNPGGLLDVAVDLVSEFIAKGDVVTTRGRKRDEQQELKVSGEPKFPKLPLVVLVNDYSASASEILAGALQVYNRGVVIGDRTFGKGSVQRVLPLGRTPARLKLTTAIYYLPDGRTPHRKPEAEAWGVDPDITLKMTPKEEREVIQRQNRALVIRNGRVGDQPKVTLSEAALKELKSEPKKDDDEDDVQPLLSEADLEALSADPYKPLDSDPQLEMALLQLRVKLAGGLPWPQKVAAAQPRAQGS